jgi:hypothetical protein
MHACPGVLTKKCVKCMSCAFPHRRTYTPWETLPTWLFSPEGVEHHEPDIDAHLGGC